MSKTSGYAETGTYSRIEELERIEEEREQSGSREPSMGESEHQSDSNTSESKDERKHDSIGTIGMGLGFNALGSYKHVGFLNMPFEIGYFNVIIPDLHVERIWKMTLKPNTEYVSNVLILFKLVRGEYTTAPSRNREGERLCERMKLRHRE